MAGLSIEEVVALHERLDDRLASAAGVGLASSLWVVPGAFLAVLLGVVLVRSASGLSASLVRGLAVGAAIYLGGALGLEALGGIWAENHGNTNVGYLLLATAEENLELVGSMMICRRLARHALQVDGVPAD